MTVKNKSIAKKEMPIIKLTELAELRIMAADLQHRLDIIAGEGIVSEDPNTCLTWLES